MFVGIGVGIGRNRFAQGIFNAYNARVVADGGITEAGNCVNAVTGLLLNASLLIIPSGYKGGKAYSEIPTNGNGDLTWTRASDAWRTNADGLIQRVPWNLLQRSEEFDNAVWSKTNATITANSTTAPNGTLTADSLIEDSTNNLHIASQSVSLAGGIYSASVYVKPNGRNWVFINIAAAGSYGAYFDIANGVVGTIQANITSATMTSAGNGWYRCVITANTGVTSPRIAIYTATANGTNSYTGDGTSGLFIWGAQLVEGSSAQTYFPTTDRLNVPRLSYMYGSCPALLLEPQRTNLCLYSQTFSDASWIALNSTKVSTSATDPSGTNTALNVTWGTGGSKYFYRTQTGLTIGTTYTITFYVKSSNASKFRIYGESLGITSSNFTTTSDFQRFQLTYTATVTSGSFGLQAASDNTAADLIVAFAQFEAGSYPTTIIPTTTASATRIADSFSRNNIYTNGLITSSGGTWFVELRGNIQYIRDAFSNGLQLADNNTSGGISGNGFIVRRNDTTLNRLSIQKVIAGVPTALFATATDTVKFAIKWNGTSADVFVNGTKEVSATAFTTTNMEFLLGYATDVPKFVQAMGLHPTPLSDTQLIQLTTL